jgi:RsiW-degrading membrane proteinase PrsW (M82 family)
MPSFGPAQTLVSLLPVLCFLGALLLLDSYKLVSLRAVVAMVAAGAAVAVVGYFANGLLLHATGLELSFYSRYLAPFVEEALKGLVIVVLIRAHRIGFLVDAAIFGFGVGAGFAIVENLNYLAQSPGAAMGLWIVRGFGTALMHGGVTALFAVMGLAIVERSGRSGWRAFVLGFALAVTMHSGFNHLLANPKAATLVTLVVLPPVFYIVFRRSEKAVGEWLGQGFDADTEMLELLNSGRLSDSPLGRYLHALRDKFQGPVVADLLCYLRLYTELALRAKGLLMMRESGFETPVDEETRAKFDEMRYLEGSIGRTGLLAIQPMLRMSHKDLWQLYMLGK